MKKTILTAAIVLTATCVFAEETKPPTLKKVSDHVWAYENVQPMSPENSYGANVGVIVGKKSVLVVDTLISAKAGEQLLKEIRKITKLPVLWAANTHYHLDHSLGNCAFVKEGATIIGAWPGPDMLKTYGPKMLDDAEHYGLSKELMEGTTIAPVTVSITGTMYIDLGDLVVELRSMPHGHCKDNLIVQIPQDKVLFTGDLLFVECHPFIGESDVDGWIKDLDILKTFGAEIIVPGHGRLAKIKDLEDKKKYLLSFDKSAKALTKDKTQKDAPEIAEQMLRVLPKQNRNDLFHLVEYNLRMKYLPQEKTESTEK